MAKTTIGVKYLFLAMTTIGVKYLFLAIFVFTDGGLPN